MHIQTNRLYGISFKYSGCSRFRHMCPADIRYDILLLFIRKVKGRTGLVGPFVYILMNVQNRILCSAVYYYI